MATVGPGEPAARASGPNRGPLRRSWQPRDLIDADCVGQVMATTLIGSGTTWPRAGKLGRDIRQRTAVTRSAA